MRIPKDPVERQQMYEELVRQCLASRSDRFSFYQYLRNYYLFGAGDTRGAAYNKVGSTVDTLCSFIYSPDGAKFSLDLGKTAPEMDIFRSIPLAREVTDQWRMSHTNHRFGMALRWSCVFGTTLLKVQWKGNGVRSWFVEPHQFGVLREDIVSLDDQEAFVLCYSITKSQLETNLEGNPRKNAIMMRAGRGGTEGGPREYAEGLSRLLLAGPVGGVPGSLAIGTGGGSIDGGLGYGGGINYDYNPKLEVEMIDMLELYVRNDEIDDYQCITIAAPNVVIYDRPQADVGLIKGVPCFVPVRPEINLYDYFWGASFVARLAWLQDWRTTRTDEIRKMLALQADPPAWGTGMVGIAEEKLLATRSPGGRLSLPNPMGKFEHMYPKVPDDMFKEIAQIDNMFDDVAGIGHVLQGKGETGVRSRGQTDTLARLGSARPKERAIAAEESAEDVATLILRNVQEFSAQRFQAPELKNEDGSPLTFIAEQFTKDYAMKVDAHSSSPIFVEDRKSDAEKLLEAHAIDRETFLEMMDPPNLQQLKKRLKVIEAKEAEMAKLQAQQGAAGHHGGHK